MLAAVVATAASWHWLCSFQGPRGGALSPARAPDHWARRLEAGLSKLNSMRPPRETTKVARLRSKRKAGRQARSTFRKPANPDHHVVWRAGRTAAPFLELPRKEVIQPHLPVRLPCYDFTPVTSPTFDGSLPQGVRPPASGVACFRGVTGGVYKARERIHRGDADPRLLATPPSWRRVSASNPNRDAL